MKCARPNCSKVSRRQGLCAAHYRHAPSGYVPVQAARDRYYLLRRRGLTTETIARLSGVDRETLRLMGTHGMGRVRRETAERIMAVRVPPLQPTKVLVPAIGTQRRIQALAAAGHSLGSIGAELGCTQQAVGGFLRNDVVAAETAVKVAALFDRLQLVPGTSTRARNWAQRRGWVVPMAWDEHAIDDPDAVPDLGEKTVLRFPDRYREMRELGLGDGEIARRLGIDRESVERQVDRYGLRSAS